MDRVPLPPKRGPGDASLTQSTPSPLGKIEASPPIGKGSDRKLIVWEK
jgi:hypothetical protein